MVSNDQGYGVVKRAQDATARPRRVFVDLRPDLGQRAARARILLRTEQSADRFGATLAKSVACKDPALPGIDLISVGLVAAYHPSSQRPAA